MQTNPKRDSTWYRGNAMRRTRQPSKKTAKQQLDAIHSYITVKHQARERNASTVVSKRRIWHCLREHSNNLVQNLCI